MRKVMGLVAVLALAACDDPPKPAPQAAAPQPAAVTAARRAAEDQVRARLRIMGDLSLRAVQVWRQHLPDTLAVCGQVNASGGPNDPFLPWVAVVSLKDGVAVRADVTLGATNAEATRVFIEMLDRCWDGGGPATARPQAPRALPPLPVEAALPRPGLPAPAASAPGPAAPAPVPAAPAVPPGPPPAPTSAGTGRTVTTTAAHPVNVRAQPGGGAPVTRVVPRASTLRVFGEAPGGWLEVGEDQPFGWVHGSMLER